MPSRSRRADVGLGYLSLGRPPPTLSVAERPRLKLATHMGEKGDVYVMNEPTSGLHLAYVERLLDRPVDPGKAIVVVEHHQAVMANVDWIIDLGRIFFEGTSTDERTSGTLERLMTTPLAKLDLLVGYAPPRRSHTPMSWRPSSLRGVQPPRSCWPPPACAGAPREPIPWVEPERAGARAPGMAGRTLTAGYRDVTRPLCADLHSPARRTGRSPP